MSRNPRLWLLSCLPLFFSFLILGLFLFALMTGLGHLVNTFMIQQLSAYSGWILGLLRIFIGFIFIFFSFQFFMILTSLMASPFNDFLAEATEKKLGQAPIPFSAWHWIYVFFLDFRKTIFTSILSVFFSLSLLIPGIGLFFLPLLALLNTFSFITYPQSRRKHGLIESLAWIFQNSALSLGFGFCTLLLFSIPVINLFALPISVVGGTLLFLGK